METARYAIALAFAVAMPPALFFWLLIHPFIRFWRSFSPAVMYVVVTSITASGAFALYQIRSALLKSDLGTSAVLVSVGVACLVVSGIFRLALHRTFSNKQLLGLPEVAPQRYKSQLVTTGLYAYVRHPRYLQFMLALLGWAVFANYLFCYLVFAMWIPGIYVIVLLEEKELRERFGAQYEEYCRRVPRFIPKLN